MLRIGMGILVYLLIFFNLVSPVFAQPVTALIPSQPSLEKGGKQPQNEVDVLIALLEPFACTGVDMDRPQFFAVLYYPENFNPDGMQPELRPLLGDVEEIRYLDKKAWGANVAIEKPGL